ncbi:TPA: YdiU family protein, partial [Burkholderia vietnamiensis]|nr:YdiU family protein [Burkholderia vietnamiensis]
DLFIDRAAFDAWANLYRARLSEETRDDAARAAAMNRVNPKYVLRNHLAEVAIRRAKDKDFSEVERLAQILRRPFDEQPEHEPYAALPPDWAGSLEVSCSS